MATRKVAHITPAGRPALTVIAKRETTPQHARLAGNELKHQAILAAGPGSKVHDILSKHDASLQPLFAPAPLVSTHIHFLGATGAHPGAETKPVTPESGDLSRFFHVDAPVDKLETLAKELLASSEVEGAYVTPAGVPPIFWEIPAPDKTNPAPAGPASTPSFIDRQGYLNAGPDGFDAQWAWTLPGGRGAGLRIVDCEWGWRYTHEDLVVNQNGVAKGTPYTDLDLVNHGTAVLGVISGDTNPYGITGIAGDAIIESFVFDQGWDSPHTAPVIKAAADILQPGDIILLEIHRPGPNTPAGEQGQFGFLPIEWWPEDFAAIQYAVQKGIIVVEAGGNGQQNLDDPVYDTPLPGFGGTWKNPFRLNNPQCGAIMVGGGGPAGTADDRSRLWYSNYGTRVDVQGWGDGVCTTGYGTLQGGDNQDRWYTADFSGTSSASPCVTGVLAVVQGVLKARGRRPLTALEAKYLLRLTGAPQRDGTHPKTERIGNRPDLRAIIPASAGFACRSGDFDGDGRAEWLVTNPRGIAIMERRPDGKFGAQVVASNGTRFGGWLLNTADNTFGPVGDFDGDGLTEAFVSSPWGVGILKQSGNTMAAPMMQSNGTRFGGWLLNTSDNCFGPAGDFDGDGRKEILVTSPWGVGILKYAGSTMSAPFMAPNGSRFGGWLINTKDNEFGPVGKFSGTAGKSEIFVSSPWGIGFLQLQGNTLAALAMAPNGTQIGNFKLDTKTQRYDLVGDFDNDGHDELMVTSPLGIGILKLVPGTGLTMLMYKENGTRFGTNGWLLNMANDHFGPVRDFDNDGKAEVVVTSPWGMGILKLAGNTFTPLVMSQNGSRFEGGWLLNTADNWLGSAAKYDESGKAGILVSSPWGMGILQYTSGKLTSQTMAPNGTAIGAWVLNTGADNLGHGL